MLNGNLMSGSQLPAASSALSGAPSNNGNRVIHTPNLDAMAKAAIQFTRFYSGGPGTNSYSPPWEHGFDQCFSTQQAVPTWDPMEVQPFVTRHWTGPGQYASENLEGDVSRVMIDRVIPFVRRTAKAGRPSLALDRPIYSQYTEDQQHYYGSITALDQQVGRLRRELRELGVAANTMTWFAGDNGPEGMTGGLRGRKRSLFSGGVNVPAWLEWPGRARPGCVENLECRTLDYFPTIREVTGFRMSGKPRLIDGVSLAPPMLEGRHKLLTNFAAGGSGDMLCDLVADRPETRNIVPKQPEMARSMKTGLRDWIESCKASHAGADYEDKN